MKRKYKLGRGVGGGGEISFMELNMYDPKYDINNL